MFNKMMHFLGIRLNVPHFEEVMAGLYRDFKMCIRDRMYENPNRFQEDQISATLRGEMAVMRLLGLNRNQHMQMAAGEISRCV